LSPEYVPGRRSERYWTDEEIAILRERFPVGGYKACAPLLPERNNGAIYTKAHALGLKGPKSGGPYRRIEVPDDVDDRIKTGWSAFSGKKGEVAELAHKLGVPRHWLTVRATKLGLVQPFHKEPPWTAAELQLLKSTPLHDLQAAAKVFRTHGFSRSPTAINIKAKKAQISRRYSATLSATAAAKILGIDSKAITSCCIDGSLKATKRETRRLVQQGGHPWSIERADLRQYVIDNLYRIDLRKVDKFAFVDLLVRTHKTRAPWSAEEDTIIRDGYARKLKLGEISQAIEGAGFAKRGTSSISFRAKELGVRPEERKDVWTPEEDAILRREYEAGTRIADIVGKLADAGFNRKRGSTQMRAIAIGITSDRVNYWTEEEKRIALAGLQAGKTHGAVREDLAAAGYIRGPTAMFKFAQKHRVIRKSDPWTAEDIEKLRQLCESGASTRTICEALGRKSAAVLTQASKLGFKRRQPWTDEEKERLRQAHAAGMKLVDCPALVGKTYAATYRMATLLRLDFRRKPQKASTA
jgi:hypothetical protein